MQKICYTIKPYQQNTLWFFDDPSVGLLKEGLTDGVPELIKKACELSKIKNLFFLTFSDQKIGKKFLVFKKPLRNGNLYHWEKLKMDCWFCPALFRYFDRPPAKIWFEVFGHKNI